MKCVCTYVHHICWCFRWASKLLLRIYSLSFIHTFFHAAGQRPVNRIEEKCSQNSTKICMAIKNFNFSSQWDSTAGWNSSAAKQPRDKQYNKWPSSDYWLNLKPLKITWILQNFQRIFSCCPRGEASEVEMRVTRSSHKSIWSTPATQKREDDEWMKFTKHFIFSYIPSLPPSDTVWMVLHLILHHFPIEIVNSSSTHLSRHRSRFSHDIENIDVACPLLHLWWARAVFALLLKLENCYLHARDWILMSLHKNNNNFLLRIEIPTQNMEFSEIHKLIKWNSHDWIESTSTMTLDINFIQLSFTRFTNIHDAFGRGNNRSQWKIHTTIWTTRKFLTHVVQKSRTFRD